MRKSIIFLALVSILAATQPNPVAAQEKPSQTKTIADNEKVVVGEFTYKPGEGSPTQKRPMRVVHYMNAGTIERTYEDGTKEVINFKAGETRIIDEQRPYSFKNIGKSAVKLLVVSIK